MWNWKSPRFARRKKPLVALSGFDRLESRAMLSAIVVQATSAPHGAVDLTVTDSMVDDFLSGVVAAPSGGAELFSSNPDGFSVNGGPSQQFPTFASIRNLTWNLGGGNDGFYLQDVSLNNLTVRQNVTTTGQDFDAIRSIDAPVVLGNVRFESSQSWNFNMDGIISTTLNSLSLTATTPVQTLMNYFPSPENVTILHDFNYTNLGANASAWINIYSNSPVTPGFNVGGNLNLNLGSGDNTVGMAMSVGGNATIITGSGNDGIGFGQGSVGKSVFIDTGSGADAATLSGRDNSPFEVGGSVTILTGQSNDLVQLENVVIDGNVFVSMDGTDSSNRWFFPDNTIFIVNAEVLGNTVVESTGEATVVITAQNSHTTRFHKSVTFILGSGTVQTSLSGFFPFDPTSQVIFDKAQVYIGVQQTITVDFDSNVVYDPSKLVLVNAVLV